ncbi:rac GTPase-activating protein 1-like [Haemaphysalis longicornis]
MGANLADHCKHGCPTLMVRCIHEVHCRGLSVDGLYWVPAGEKEVQDLRAQFQRGNGIPNLVGIHVACSVLKEFLSSLTETLITKSLMDVFAKATDQLSGDRACRLWQAGLNLPPANRNTLAALVLHL